MSNPQPDDGVEPMTDNHTSSVMSGHQRLCLSTITWSTGNGFSCVLIDEKIKSGIHQPLPSPAEALQACYRISKAPGKGLGMFATKDINPGDRILVEYPLLVVPKQIMQFPVPECFIYNILIAPFQDTPAFEAFFALANCYPLTGHSLPFDVFMDNAKKVRLGEYYIACAPVPFTYNVPDAQDSTVPDVKDAKAIAETNALDIEIQDPK